MPELPEVETIKSMLVQHVVGQSIQEITIRRRDLRWPIPADFERLCQGKEITAVTRRSKYLLWHLQDCVLVGHLGMSGSLQLTPAETPLGKHDHIIMTLSSADQIRYNDPRRFGSWLAFKNIEDDKRLMRLGPEPLSDDFSVDHCYGLSRNRHMPIKSFLMNAAFVVGIGNIYANETLFLAGIRPHTPCHLLKKKQLSAIVRHAKQVICAAIEQGGTTLKDYKSLQGKPGYFAQHLNVYGRGGQPCLQCGHQLKSLAISGRQTVWCNICQL